MSISAPNLKGHELPVSGTALEVNTTFDTFSRSISDLPGVPNETAANQLANIPGIRYPVHVWRTDLHAHMVKETPSGAWQQVGGQDYYAEVEAARSLDPATFADMHVDAFNNRSEGWTIDGGGLIIPSTGMWTVNVGGRIEGIWSHTQGRRFLDLTLDGTVLPVKFFVTDSDGTGGSWTFLATAGQKFYVRAYHETGARRAVYVNFALFKVGNPRIVG